MDGCSVVYIIDSSSDLRHHLHAALGCSSQSSYVILLKVHEFTQSLIRYINSRQVSCVPLFSIILIVHKYQIERLGNRLRPVLPLCPTRRAGPLSTSGE